MGFFQVRYDSWVVNYDRKLLKRLASVVNNNNSKEPRTDVEVDLLLGMACPDMP